MDQVKLWIKAHSKAIGTAVGFGIAIAAAMGLDVSEQVLAALTLVGALTGTYIAPANVKVA